MKRLGVALLGRWAERLRAPLPLQRQRAPGQRVHGVAAMAGHSRGIGTRGSLARTLLRSTEKTIVILWFPPDRLRFDFILWETGRSKLWRGRKWIQDPHTEAPPEASFPYSSEAHFWRVQVAQPGNTSRSAATWKAQNKFWRHGDSFLTDLPGPWVSGAWQGNREQGKETGHCTLGRRTEQGVWLVFTLGFWAYVKSMG